jgi:hypothetical protein
MSATQEPFLGLGAPNSERERLISNGSTDALLAAASDSSADFVTDKALTNAGPKSLFFCLVLDNPFDEENPENRIVDESLFIGERETNDGPATGLSDDELLSVPPSKGLLRGDLKGNQNAPNKFQKVIEIVLRMQTRQIDFLPGGMIRRVANPTAAAGFTPNYYRGYELVKERLLSSPDGDELYIKIHGKRSVLLNFAEAQGVALNTHALSYIGGAPVPYSKELEKKLADSVEIFSAAFPEEVDRLDDDEDAAGASRAAKYLEGGAPKKKKVEGFILDVPDKMRLITRLMREAWKYGGCGIQIAEMKKHGVLVRHFFPLHNEAYQKSYGLDKWSSFKQMFTREPLYQVEEHIVKYFGEEVALYFIWIRKFTLFLRFIAFFGLLAAVLGYAANNDAHAHQYFPISLVNGIFAVICCVWGLAWNFHWLRYESTFATKYGQEAQMKQELVRDQFEKDRELPVSIPDIYKCRFDYPVTLRNHADGSMVDLHYNPIKRTLVRYLVSYPTILVLSGGMVVALIYNTKWRFMYPEDDRVSYGSSVVTIVIGFVFGMLFEKIVPTLNAWENNRTDSEETSQSISKSFLFYFLSYYFALFTIALWPSDDTGATDNSRLDQLSSQMLIITLVKPMVQNAQELLMPWFNAQMRRRTDVYKSSCKALCSLLCCRSVSDMETAPTTVLEVEGRRLWLEAQAEPYESTSGDYLEITLQFGYMTMFAATFPLAAVAAFLYNILELRVDARKLIHECQRPVATPAVSIGAWNAIFLFLSTLSIVTNSYLTAVISPFPKQLHFDMEAATRYKIFAAFQYILVMGFFVVYSWQGGASLWSNKTKSKYHILANKSTRLRFERLMKERAQSTEASV